MKKSRIFEGFLAKKTTIIHNNKAYIKYNVANIQREKPFCKYFIVKIHKNNLGKHGTWCVLSSC
jgi:hypothetical protein